MMILEEAKEKAIEFINRIFDLSDLRDRVDNLSTIGSISSNLL
ncbi:hypothetical protein [Lusitaniella coriacea]|nr:hypothetical protein [Lusitaniella coriacea]